MLRHAYVGVLALLVLGGASARNGADDTLPDDSRGPGSAVTSNQGPGSASGGASGSATSTTGRENEVRGPENEVRGPENEVRGQENEPRGREAENEVEVHHRLHAAVLPSGRAVRVGRAATAFVTVINSHTAAATNCTIAPVNGNLLPATFSFQPTDPATNKPVGTPNAPVTIPAGKFQTFIVSFTPTGRFEPREVEFRFNCDNAGGQALRGINTLNLSASDDDVPDVIALSATLTNDGIVVVPGNNGTGIFSLATVNVGGNGAITVSADFNDDNLRLPVTVTLCPTNPTTGVCLTPPAERVNITINTNATPTFALFVAGAGRVDFDPAGHRIRVRFHDDRGALRGSTSVAVRTQ